MNSMEKSTAVALLVSPTVQSLMDGGQYKPCGPDSIASRVVRAARVMNEVFGERKPSSLSGKLAMEFYVTGIGRVLMRGSDVDFAGAATRSLDRAEAVESQLSAPDVEEPIDEEYREPEAPSEDGDPEEPKPDDVPVERLAEHGIPARVIEVLAADGLTTAKAVLERDARQSIIDLEDIGPAIRKKVLAAIEDAIA